MTQISAMIQKASLPASAARVPVVIDGDATNYNYDLGADLSGRPTNASQATAIAAALSVYPTSAALAATTGATLVSYGSRTVAAKLGEAISVEDFGADPTGTNDSYSAFAAAVAALPSSGGTIRATGAAYQLSAEPDSGTKSVQWQFGPNTAFSGAGAGSGLFRYMITNVGQMAVGPYIVSKTAQVSANSLGGVSAFNVEIDPTATGAGQFVAGYFGARASIANSGANHWALNTMLRVESTATGEQQCIEVDVDNYSASATVKGIEITGVGTHSPTVGLEITRADETSNWITGLKVWAAQDGIIVQPIATGRGVVVETPTNNVTPVNNAAISARQFQNGAETLYLQRFTDTSPTGDFLQCVDTAGAVLANIDAEGNYGSTGNMVSNNHIVTGATQTVASGKIGIGTTTATSATAGANGAVPSQVLGYLVMNLGGTAIKVPYYAA